MSKPLPTDIDKLKAMLKKLKNEEALLQADFAIKELPYLEEEIANIVKCFVEFERLEGSLIAMRVSKSIVLTEVDNTSQVKYFQEKLEKIRAAGGDYSSIERRLEILGNNKPRTFDKDIGIINTRNAVYDRLLVLYTNLKEELDDCGVDLDRIMPNLKVLLKRGKI